ncbi:MAG TPA: hypothetical protein PLW32_02835 [Chitinophagaceae bacterium]|jgi:hypothetical protein|nr:hypothetical protein [Chitinophagaceae bacterium]MBP9739647.1 hypothetical protein [Chitinophagaceae bacterium]HPH22794.1 hypothetical protein [Chitinophagaceae bacterium]
MKLKFIPLILVLCICLFTNNGKTQITNGIAFLDDFNFIVEDAKMGFSKCTGGIKEKIDWYGTKYTSNKSIFNIPNSANLQYIKGHEPTKYVPEATPELFYFGQAFKVGNVGFEFIKDSLEIFLDEAAKELGLTKKIIKLTKEYKKIHRKIEYQKNGKAVFAIFNLLDATYYEVQIYSPYRPADVPKAQNKLGCVVFNYPRVVFAYIVTVYGDKIDNMDQMILKAFKSTGLTDNGYIYSWYPNKSVEEVKKQIGNSMSFRETGSITLN